MEDSRSFPAGYFVAARSDGSLLVVQGTGPRRAARAGFTFWGAVGYAALAAMLTGRVALLPGCGFPDPSRAAFDLSVPVLFLAAFLAQGTLWRAHGREEWCAGPSYLERRWGWSFSCLSKRRYTAGEFEIWWNLGSTRASWDLYLKPRGSWLGARLICRVEDGEHALLRLRNLAALLSRCTGWRVVERTSPRSATSSP